MGKKKRVSILEFSAKRARKFFLKAESYCNFDLPPYFVFDPILGKIDKSLLKTNLRDMCDRKQLRESEGVNYEVVSNKDGKLAWRPMRLIHPALYVDLVHTITDEENWKAIQDRFGVFRKNSKIQCLSIPVVSRTKRKDKAEQVLQWWREIEQKSIQLSLTYEYTAYTDITDCYGSIYTHSVAWALHNRNVAKKKKHHKNLIGNMIDGCLQDMNQGQTNGIPQGSVLMDFVAEMILGYADHLLTKKITRAKNLDHDYKILRYRDDYRIFVKEPTNGEQLLQLISETIYDLGMKLNSAKTDTSNRVVQSAIKQDKINWFKAKQYDKNLQRHLLLIHNYAASNPNSGSLIRALTEFHRHLTKFTKARHDVEVLIALVVDIAVHNPKIYPVAAAILSLLLRLMAKSKDRTRIIRQIVGRFDRVPNTGQLQVWLQRVSMFYDKDITYNEKLCQLVAGSEPEIWNSEWITNKALKSKLCSKHIYSDNERKKLKSMIDSSEFYLFDYQSG